MSPLSPRAIPPSTLLQQLAPITRVSASLRAPSIPFLSKPVAAFAFSCFPASLIIAVTIAELRVVID